MNQLFKNTLSGEIHEVVLYPVHNKLVVQHGITDSEISSTSTTITDNPYELEDTIKHKLELLGYKTNIHDVLDKPNSFIDGEVMPSCILNQGKVEHVTYPCYVRPVTNTYFYRFNNNKLYDSKGNIEEYEDAKLQRVQEITKASLDIVFQDNKPVVVDIALAMNYDARRMLYFEAYLDDQLDYFVEDEASLNKIIADNPDCSYIIKHTNSFYNHAKHMHNAFIIGSVEQQGIVIGQEKNSSTVLTVVNSTIEYVLGVQPTGEYV